MLEIEIGSVDRRAGQARENAPKIVRGNATWPQQPLLGLRNELTHENWGLAGDAPSMGPDTVGHKAGQRNPLSGGFESVRGACVFSFAIKVISGFSQLPETR